MTLPLNLLFFTTTRGHYGNDDVYQTTLNHLEKQLGESSEIFNRKYAHIKVREKEQAKLAPMQKWLEDKGFLVVSTVADWERGISHQNEYLKDIHHMFTLSNLQHCEYTFWLEDDFVLLPQNNNNITYLLEKGIRLLKSNPLILTLRFMKEGLWKEIHFPKVDGVDGLVVSQTYDFQPNILRSRDGLFASLVIQKHWEQFRHMQCEAVFAQAMSSLINSEIKFLCYDHNTVYSKHIGEPNYKELIKEL